MKQINKFNLNDAQLEIQTRGVSGFPISVYGTKMSEYTLGYLEAHWHNELQFTCVLEGVCQFQVNQQMMELTAGMGCFINSSCLHMAKPVTPNVSFMHIVFEHSILSGYPGSLIDLTYVAPFIHNEKYPFVLLREDVSWQGDILNRINQIIALHHAEPYFYELDTNILMLQAWKILIANFGAIRPVGESLNYSRLKQMISFIHAHYKERISLQQLADEVHLCRNECCKYFKKYMHCTIFEYIEEYRLSQCAKALLDIKDMSISDIAFEYGFCSASSFIEKFRRKTGVTPGAYRRTSAGQ